MIKANSTADHAIARKVLPIPAVGNTSDQQTIRDATFGFFGGGYTPGNSAIDPKYQQDIPTYLGFSSPTQDAIARLWPRMTLHLKRLQKADMNLHDCDLWLFRAPSG